MAGPPGKGKPSSTPNLVKGLAGRIVYRAADALIETVTAHDHKLAVPPRYDQSDENGECKLDEVRRQPKRIDMPFQVVDAEQRQPSRQRQPLGEVDADKQRADQTGSLRDGDGVEVGVSQRRLRSSPAPPPR